MTADVHSKLRRGEGELEHIEPFDSRRFQIAIRAIADSLNYGTDSSRFMGSGVDYVQSRPYVYGDPVRAIDWRVTGRTGRVHVKDYEAPKSVPVYLLLDTSASMTLQSGKQSKYAMALHIAGGLAFAALDRVSPVGVLGAGDSEFRVEPSLSKTKIMQWLLRLRRFRYDEGTTLGRRLLQLQTDLRQTSVVMVLSDLHDPEASAAMKVLGQQHDVVALQLQDPAETTIPGAGLLRAREAETGRTFVTHGRRLAAIEQDRLAADLRRAGVDHLLLRTDQPFLHALRNFFVGRGLLGGGGR